jgi:hypothetical protein
MQFLAWFEADRSAGHDRNLSARARIPADSSFPGSNAEDAKAAQLNAIPGCKSIFHAFEYSIDSSLSLDAWQPGTVGHLVNDVLFNQGFPPAPRPGVALSMLFPILKIVNALALP